MSLIEAFFHPDILLALAAYTATAAVLLLITTRVAIHIDEMPADHWWYKAFSGWYLQHIWIPLIRVFSIIAFIVLAYPVLFGLKEASPILELLAADDRINTLVNVLFVVTIGLSLLPVVDRLHALVLPLQGMAAILLLVNWLLPAQDAPSINFWPNGRLLAGLLLMALLSHWLALKTAEVVGGWLDEQFDREGFEILVYHMTLLFFQAPIILSYSLYLGEQLYKSIQV